MINTMKINVMQVEGPVARALVGIAVTYMALIVILPFFNVFVQAFANGAGPFFETLLDPDFQQSVKMTLLLSLVAVPINTVFGITSAIFLARNDFPGKVFAISVLDLPFSISPVVTGTFSNKFQRFLSISTLLKQIHKHQ